MKRVHLIISGKVQGINFRHKTRRKAVELGIKGWVKNTSDECVEVVAEGNEDRLNELIEWCQKGPEKAEVEFVQIEWEKYQGEFDKFERRY